MKLATTITQTSDSHPPLVLIHGLGSAATAIANADHASIFLCMFAS